MSRRTAYVGASIYPVEGPRYDPGVLLVVDGQIASVGDVDTPLPGDVEVVNLEGKFVLPGFIDAHSHLGLWGDGEGRSSNDANEMPDAVNAKIRSLDAANPRQRGFASAREGGITTVNIVPLGNPIAGTSFACKAAGTIIDHMVVRAPTGLKCALGEGPKRAHGLRRGKAPSTRMGIASLVRDFFARAREYARKRQSDPSLATDLDLEAGAMVLAGEIPFRVHAHRHDDIASAVRICEELGIEYSIEHCTTGYLMADYLGQKKITAHVGPGLVSRNGVERARADDRNAAILDAAGVRVCLITDHPFMDSRYMLLHAAVVHKHGMPLDRVLRALTLHPAQSLGIDDRVGSLVPGKDADFVVLSSEPFSYRSFVTETYINGEKVYDRPKN